MIRFQLEGFVGDEITPVGVSEKLTEAAGDDITVDLYTVGGQIYDGIEVYNRIANYPGKKTAVLGGLVASIGTYISTAFDTIQAQSSTVFMVHNAGSMMIGDADAMEKEAKELRKLNNHIAERLAERSGKKKKDILDMMDAETYLYGQEIVDQGFADELLENKNAVALDKDACKRLIASAKEEHKNRIAAKNKKPEEKGNDTVNDGIRIITNKEIQTMDKKELLQRIDVLRQNGDITLLEIAKSMGLENQIVTEETRQAVETVNRFNEAGIKDIEAEMKRLQEKAEKAEKAERENTLLENFGPRKNKDGSVNVVRDYAEKVYNSETSIEDIKNDEIMKRLQAQNADYTSEANRLGVVEEQQKQKNDGPKTVKY